MSLRGYGGGGGGGGGVAPTQVSQNVVSKTGAYTAAAGDAVMADATAGAFTVTLPASPAAGNEVLVKKVDASANAVTIGGTVDGVANPTLAYRYQSVELIYDGAAWQRVVRMAGSALVDFGAANGVATLTGTTLTAAQLPASVASVASLQRAIRNASGAKRGSEIVAGRTAWNGRQGASNGTVTYANYRSVHTIVAGATDLRLLYSAAWAHEIAALGGPILVTAAIEYPAGTNNVYQVTFNGRVQVTIDAAASSPAAGAGGLAISDPVGIQVPAGAVIAVRTFVTPTTNVGSGGKWPVGDPPLIGLLNGTNYTEAGLTATGATADQTMSEPYFTANASSGTGMFKPIAVLGTPLTIPTVVLGGWGDSIMDGTGDYVGGTAVALPMAGKGAWRRAVNDAYPFLNLAMPGETALQTSTDASRTVRGPLFTGCSHVFYNLGVNDLKSGGASLAQLQGYVLAAWTYLVNRGVTGLNGRSGVIASTLVPNTTSADGWASTGAQTVTSWEAPRVGFNTWLRAGAPIDPTSKAAVAVGTPGALVAGTAGHPLLSYLDLAATVETSLNSGLWAVANRGVSDAAITSATATLTSATANFTAADKDTNVVVKGAGAAAADLIAQIASVTNSTTAVLNASAGTTVSAAKAGIGTVTYDGTHPSTAGHLLMAAAAAWATPTALATLLA